MRIVNLMLHIRPLLVRRLLLVLFAGPILVITGIGWALGATGVSVQRLCWCFDSAWADREIQPLESSAG
jgi:hypothetical protein